jgi:ABC-type lipoprotein release transport system permease subunit
MRNKINFYLLEYALSSLLRQKSKNIFIALVLTLLIFLLSALFFIASSIKYELLESVDALPEITVQKLQGGKHTNIPSAAVDTILAIHGVEDAVARVWGYYFFQKAGVPFVLVGVDPFEVQYKQSLQKIVDAHQISGEEEQMIVGQGVYEILKKHHYSEALNFIKPDGTLYTLPLGGVFRAEVELESNDMIILSKQSAREIFGIDESMATDIVVRVANPQEIAMVASKIQLAFPDARIVTKEALHISYANIIDYKSGVFLSLFIVSLFTFFMIIYDKLSGVSTQEKREIGILKALGWKVDMILKEKFYEAFIISFMSYLLGVSLALFYVYSLHAPLLRNIFEGYSVLRSSFKLPFVLDFQTLALLFFLSIPIYIAATIIPSWRVATQEADEVMR